MKNILQMLRDKSTVDDDQSKLDWNPNLVKRAQWNTAIEKKI